MAWNLDAATMAWLLLTLALLAVIALLAWRLHRCARAHRSPHDGLWLRVEVRNPLELAWSRSRWGGRLGTWAPGMVTRRVYEIVSNELGSELAERGVEARVEIQRGG